MKYNMLKVLTLEVCIFFSNEHFSFTRVEPESENVESIHFRHIVLLTIYSPCNSPCLISYQPLCHLLYMSFLFSYYIHVIHTCAFGNFKLAFERIKVTFYTRICIDFLCVGV